MTDREAVLYQQMLAEQKRVSPAFRTGNQRRPVDGKVGFRTVSGAVSQNSTGSFAPGKFFGGDQRTEAGVTTRIWRKWLALRRDIFNRDDAVCKLCALDTKALEFALNYVRMKIQNEAPSFDCTFFDFKRAVGVNASRFPERSWDIDHIIPRSEGGTDDLANLRTLCLSCHREETKKLMARRAKQRRKQFRRR